MTTENRTPPPEPDKGAYCGGCRYNRPVGVVTAAGYLCTSCADPVVLVTRLADAIDPFTKRRK